MLDLGWKARMVPDMTISINDNTRQPQPPKPVDAGIFSPRPASSPATWAYDHYLRLPELHKLWTSRDFPSWKNEAVVKPALQALEITFRFISVVLSDPRPYINRREWTRRLDSLAAHEIAVIASFCRDPTNAPISDLHKSPEGVLTRDRSSQEVWIPLPGAAAVVSRTSEESLLPRLATWERSEEVASRIMLQIECQLRSAGFTLGLGEPNLTGKPNLEYDLVCRPSEVHSLKKSPVKVKNNPENETVFTAQQILESWVFVGKQVLLRVGDSIRGKEWEKAAEDCWVLESIWKLLVEIEEVHMVMDPDDFLRLKNQLAIKATGEAPLCFRSTALWELTRASKDLKQEVPAILGVDVDPNGGPRVQEAAMRLFHTKTRASTTSMKEEDEEEKSKVELLQAFQAVDAAVKKFFFAYRQVIVTVMGSLEATTSALSCGGGAHVDPLTQMFSEPSYFPSLDAAKTFLGEHWHREHNTNNKINRKNVASYSVGCFTTTDKTGN